MENIENTAALDKLSEEIFDKMQQACHDEKFMGGFHFAYSPKSTWKTNTRVLILTLNPQINGKGGLPEAHWPEKPWPEPGNHDFFRDDNNFTIKRKVQWLHQLLALRDPKNFPDLAARGPEYGKWLDSNPRLKEFACNNVALASFVPFRTASEKDIQSWMWEFSTTQYWPRLLKIWQPELIIAIGTSPFLGTRNNGKKIKGLNDILNDLYNSKGEVQEYNVREFSAPADTCTGNLKYRLREFKYLDKNITLIGLPHVSGARGTTGWPKDNSDCRTVPLYKFLDGALGSFSF